MRTPKVEIYRSTRVLSVKALEEPDNPEYVRAEWRWRHWSSNGRKIAESGEGYVEPRSLVRALEILHPGWAMAVADRDGDRVIAWCLLNGRTFSTIPVTVPEGTESLWAARRKR